MFFYETNIDGIDVKLMVNGKNKTADTVLYEKRIGEKSYYVVQAIPDTKVKTLYIVTVFIGKKDIKKKLHSSSMQKALMQRLKPILRMLL